MPSDFLANKCHKQLIKIGVSKRDLVFVIDEGYLLKSLILNGNSVDIRVVADNEFLVEIQDNIYYSSLSVSYRYSKYKVERQGYLINTILSDQNSPMVWAMISAYYLSFYAALEIMRVSGRHQMHFYPEMINDINSNNISGSSLTNHGDYTGQFLDVDAGGTVSISFKRTGNRPHSSCWKNISDILKSSEIRQIQDIRRRRELQVLKNMVDQNFVDSFNPNDIRNHWNYSKADAYSFENDSIFDIFKNIFENKVCDTNWITGNIIPKTSPREVVGSIAFLSNVLIRSFKDTEKWLLLD